MTRALTAVLLLLLAACAHKAPPDAVTTVNILAFNDLHGHLEPPRRAIEVPGPGGEKVPAGGMPISRAPSTACAPGIPIT